MPIVRSFFFHSDTGPIEFGRARFFFCLRRRERIHEPGPATRRLIPGVVFSAIIGLAAVGLATIESRVFGRPIIEALVVAILLGMTVRTAFALPSQFDAGVGF